MATQFSAGTLTYLLTDVERSSELWERDTASMREALARHDALIETGVAQGGGSVVRPRGEGDSRFAVFPRATDAVSAACAIQRALLAEPWRTPAPLRVRMALHTGEAELREGDYYGTAVNRCARLRALAHGAQILLSSTTAKLVEEGLAAGLSLRDLGLHHLKDLQLPERVFQVVHPELPDDFPPLRSLESLPNNLPVQLSSFVGREREMEEVKRHLAAARLLTLSGAGGAGKTRLALQVAADILDEYPDGAWFVELASIADEALVPQAVASSLGIRESAGSSVAAMLGGRLAGRSLLLLLDNCEHLIRACAAMADMLLRLCPKLRILATSREALAIAGEVVWLVPSLAVPVEEGSAGGPDRLAALTRFESVRLFVDRARAVLPTFALAERNAAAVAQICRRLDGIPLALELAAARVRAVSVEQIASRLDDMFRFLTGGSRTALPRQQTLQALIDWSHGLLTEEERILFRRLSVFVGGWTLEAAEAVCAGDGLQPAGILDLLSQLVNKSLVAVEEQDGESRYRFLETIRQYARGKLFESGETERLAHRHLEFYLAFAEHAEAGLPTRDQQVWLNRLHGEHDNLRAAVEWSKPGARGAAAPGAGAPAASAASAASAVSAQLRLVGALWRFWYLRGYLSEGRRNLDEAIEASAGASSALRARALAGAGLIAHAQGDYAHAPALAEESLAEARRAGDEREVMLALDVMSLLAEYREDYQRAVRLLEEALALGRKTGDTAGTARALVRLGSVKLTEEADRPATLHLIEEGLALYRELGHKGGISSSTRALALAHAVAGHEDTAIALLEDSIAMCKELGDKGGTAFATLGLAFIAMNRGDTQEAKTRSQESFSLYTEVGNKWGIAGSLVFLAHLATLDSDFTNGAALARRSMGLYRELGEAVGAQHCFFVFAVIARKTGNEERAVRLIAAADDLRGRHIPPVWSLRPFTFPFEEETALLRGALGEERYGRAWREGKAMAVEEATAYALEERAIGNHA